MYRNYNALRALHNNKSRNGLLSLPSLPPIVDDPRVNSRLSTVRLHRAYNHHPVSKIPMPRVKVPARAIARARACVKRANDEPEAEQERQAGTLVTKRLARFKAASWLSASECIANAARDALYRSARCTRILRGINSGLMISSYLGRLPAALPDALFT